MLYILESLRSIPIFNYLHNLISWLLISNIRHKNFRSSRNSTIFKFNHIYWFHSSVFTVLRWVKVTKIFYYLKRLCLIQSKFGSHDHFSVRVASLYRGCNTNKHQPVHLRPTLTLIRKYPSPRPSFQTLNSPICREIPWCKRFIVLFLIIWHLPGSLLTTVSDIHPCSGHWDY